MTITGYQRLATNVDSYSQADLASTMETAESAQYAVQLDIHGDASAANMIRVEMAWRSPWACAFLRSALIHPLYASDPVQAPFMNAEEQYETRWTITIYLQAKPVLTLPQDYATALSPSL